MRKPVFNNKYHDAKIANEKGVILVTVILLLLILGLLIFTGTQWAQMDIKRTKDYTKTREAFYIAETGIQLALNFLNFDGAGNTPGTADDGFDQELADGTSFGTDWPAATFQDVSYHDGTYTVTITDNDDGDSDLFTDIDNSVIVTSVGIKKGVTSTIEAIVYRGRFVSDGALITDDDLDMSGTFDMTGDVANVHSNGNLDTDGSSGTISGQTTAVGTCTGVQCDASGYDYDWLPLVDPADFETYAKTKFKTNGTIKEIDTQEYDATDLVDYRSPVNELSYEKIATTVTNDVFDAGCGCTVQITKTYACWKPIGDTTVTRCNGSNPTNTDSTNTAGDPLQQYYLELDLKFGNVKKTGSNLWSITGDKAPQNTMIYVEEVSPTEGGRIKVIGSPDPWTVSIISTGYIAIEGNTTIKNWMDPTQDEGIQNILFMVGTDIKTKGGVNVGEPGNPEPGFIYARDQINFGGGIYLDGWVIAKDDEVSPTSDPDGLIDHNKVSGDMELHYDGGLSAPFPGPVRILTWRELAVVS